MHASYYFCLLLAALPLLADAASDARPDFQAAAWAGITIERSPPRNCAAI